MKWGVLILLCNLCREGDAKNDVQVANRRLEALNLGMKNVETGLDCLFTRLIQNRVSLLNNLTP